ncbi:MAG TPA: CpsB/CapC family capsule biosynthesis tyrosine phosphatase [Thermoanaerobaculia bacterium]|nr:CpsB/CapC family capsule biosynthesis tyrosine phosphatase [Thermoanaerobaculia bacterium]
MIDLHCHVLPGVDDGAGDLSEALAMCRMAAADGCTTVFATPHQRHPAWWNGDRSALQRHLDTLRRQLGSTLDLRSGGEIRVDSELLHDLDRFPDGGLLPLGSSRYLLLELDRTGLGPDPLPLVHELAVAGWRPILAHPEHYPWLMVDRRLLAELVERGALLQITAMSLLGHFGTRPEQWSRELLDRGLVHFVASDAHDTVRRPPGLSAAAAAIRRSWGEEVARALTQDNPRAVLENRPLPALVGA